MRWLRRKASTKGGNWEEWWNARTEAMQVILGPMDDMVVHAVIPFDFGFEAGGLADVISFSGYLDGIVYATSELIGRDAQIPNDLVNYELMICFRKRDEWGPNLLSRLAYYTRDARLNPRETMELGSFSPEGSTLAGFLFYKFATFRVRDRNAGLLPCLGITQAEMEACMGGKTDHVIQRLKEAGIYPYTDFERPSVI